MANFDPMDVDARDILLLSGGAALIMMGAGLLLANPMVRRSVGANLPAVLPKLPDNLKNGVGAVMPDFERYLKLRSM